MCRVRTLCMRGVVVVGEVVDEEVEAVPRHEPARDRSGVRVDRPAGPVAHRERSAGHIRLEEVVEEEALRAIGRSREDRHGRQVRRAAAVAGDVDGGGREAGVLERLVDGHGTLPEMARVQLVDRVLERAPGSGGPDGAERGAVLDEPLLPAVVPDEVRDLVDVRVSAGDERREADGRQGRKGRDRAAIAPVRGEESERGRGAVADDLLEHRRRQPVDHDQDEALSLWQENAGRRTGRPGSGAV